MQGVYGNNRRGHVLLDDIPGVGKTTMAHAFANALGLKYNRIQFTPDVMPSDITGFSMYNRQTGKFEFKQGGGYVQPASC